jgi:hypothetical protein
MAVVAVGLRFETVLTVTEANQQMCICRYFCTTANNRSVVDLPLHGKGRWLDRASPTIKSVPLQGFGLDEFLVHLPTCLAVDALALRAFCRPCAPCRGPCTTRCSPAHGERGKLAGAGRVRSQVRGTRGGHLAGVGVGVFPGAPSVPSPDYEADLAPSEDYASYEGLYSEVHESLRELLLEDLRRAGLARKTR